MAKSSFQHIGSFFQLEFGNGIFHLNLTQDIEGTADQAWEWLNCMMDIRTHLGRPFPLLTLVNKKVEFSSAGRAIMRLAEDQEHFVAHAMIAKNLAIKAMVKFLMIMVPRNLFDEDVFVKPEKALAWLENQINASAHEPIQFSDLSGLTLSSKKTPISF